MKSHRSFLKPFVEETFMGKPTPLYFHQRTVPDIEAAPDEWEVDKILSHRTTKKGELEFLTKWQGFDVKDATWEPVGNFFHRYSADFIKYIRHHKLPVNIATALSPNPQ